MPTLVAFLEVPAILVALLIARTRLHKGGSLQEALDSLKADHDFLTKGGVYTKDQIEAYIDLKQEEQDRYRMTPHPVEFDMYYSC